MRYLSSAVSRRRAQASENVLKMQSALRFLSETELADLVGDARVVLFLEGEEDLPDDTHGVYGSVQLCVVCGVQVHSSCPCV